LPLCIEVSPTARIACFSFLPAVSSLPACLPARSLHPACPAHCATPACHLFYTPHACLPVHRTPALQDRVSPAWEMIPAARHIFLMLCNPLHSVTAFELPVYHPSEEERKDPKLYAHNVRKLMVRRFLFCSVPVKWLRGRCKSLRLEA